MPIRSRAGVGALFASTLLAASCRSAVVSAEWVASPVLQVAAADTDETCEKQPHLVPPLATDRKLRIGSWNMHYLGPSEKTPDEKRDPRELAEYIRLSGASVLALQEIGVGQTNPPRSATLDAVCDELRRSAGADWTYLLYGEPEKDTNQFVGLAWDRRVVTQVGETMPLKLNGSSPGLFGVIPFPFLTEVWMRKPFALQLSTGAGSTDLVVIPVHLTARVETWIFEDATAHREVEADLLCKSLDSVIERFDDRDVVVLGDCNIEAATEGVTEVMLKRGWRDLNCAHLATYELDLALDRVFVPNDQPEFGLPRNFYRIVPPNVASMSDFVERYSDHFLVVADVLMGADDD